jgi:hypothetical protein
MHTGRTLTIYYSWHETSPQTNTQFCNRHNINISLMWVDQYLKNTLQLKFWNNVKLAQVLGETSKISVNTKYLISVGKLTKSSTPHTRWHMQNNYNICWMLQTVTHSSEVTDSYLTNQWGVLTTWFSDHCWCHSPTKYGSHCSTK